MQVCCHHHQHDDHYHFCTSQDTQVAENIPDSVDVDLSGVGLLAVSGVFKMDNDNFLRGVTLKKKQQTNK